MNRMNLVDGDFVTGASSHVEKVQDPATARVSAEIPDASPEQVAAAAQAADPGWS